MNHKILFKKAVCITSLLCGSQLYAAIWTLMPNSHVGFHIDSMGINIVKGQFKRVQSSLNFDPQAPQHASTQFVMDANSLSINKSSLKNMIMGEDLFNVAKYKTVTFKSTSFKALDHQKYQIYGQLTLRGVTKPVIFNTSMKPNPTDAKLMDFESATVIKRSDFGMRKAVGGVGEKVNIQVSGQWKVQ